MISKVIQSNITTSKSITFLCFKYKLDAELMSSKETKRVMYLEINLLNLYRTFTEESITLTEEHK